jgi:hypothetical protein
MKEYAVPFEVQRELSNRVDAFNNTELLGTECRYCLDARGKFIYVCRLTSDGFWQRLGRLTYEGNLENMEFAIFKFSSGKYDPKDRWFIGVQHLDGTIEGALKSLSEAYPA